MSLPTRRSDDTPIEWVDRHRLWRRILADYREALSKAPDGFRPVVKVYLKSRVAPLELGFVRTSRDPEYPWVRFEISEGVRPGSESETLAEDAEWVYTHESDVQRVEISFEEGPPFDFENFQVLEDDPRNGR